MLNFVYAEIIKKTGLKEVSTDDLKEIANKDKKFNPLMDLIKLLSDIFCSYYPCLSCRWSLDGFAKLLDITRLVWTSIN